MSSAPRLETIEISDFRSISGTWQVPLDAGVVLVHGLNGAGKTSFLSAIELAATGSVAHLDRASGRGHFPHLRHRDSERGNVTLRATGQNLSGSASIDLDADGPHGDPLLHGVQRDFFSERCFLPQTTLARLLEMYVPANAKGDQSSLTRFVKELVGLDALESLIEGLDASKNIRTTESFSAPWSAAIRERDFMRREVDAARLELEGLQKEADEAALVLSDLMDDEKAGQILRTAADQLIFFAEQELSLVDNSAATSLRESQIRLSALQKTLDGLSPDSAVELERLRITVKRADDYWDGDGAELLKSGSELAGALSLEPWSKSDIDQSLRHAVAEAEKALEVTRDGLAQHRSQLGELRALESQLEVSQNRLEQLHIQRDSVDVPHDVRELSAMLSLAMTLGPTEGCPLCDQPYEGGQVGLQRHFERKFRALSEGAQQVFDIDQKITLTNQNVVSLTEQIEGLASKILPIEQAQALEERVTSLTTVSSELSRLEPLVAHAVDIETASVTAKRAETRAASDLQLISQLEEDLVDLVQSLKVKQPDGNLGEQIAELGYLVSARLEGLMPVATRREQLTLAVSSFKSAEEQRLKALDKHEHLGKELAELESKIREATRRKESASSLRLKAEHTRTSVMRSVFDENLNSTWSRLFRRLAPLEPYVPRFKRDDAKARALKIALETVDRNGLPAASPEAMLSYGNVNTAALSLFLSLHFTVPSTLPWLILDDPIQSMDDVHVANFASLLKQLTRAHGRQVMLAVHQRELFEYLQLELTPASAADEVIAVSIERQDNSRTKINHHRLTFEPDTSIRAA